MFRGPLFAHCCASVCFLVKRDLTNTFSNIQEYASLTGIMQASSSLA